MNPWTTKAFAYVQEGTMQKSIVARLTSPILQIVLPAGGALSAFVALMIVAHLV
jgi:hypothetical protein